MYRYLDAGLLRAVAYPTGLTIPVPPELSGGDDADCGQWRHWIQRSWALKPVAEAVELASPVLARRLSDVSAGVVGEPREIRRIAMALYRYVLRLQHRSTPFGLFAGVAPVRIGPAAVVRWGESHRIVARPDAAWLSEIVASLETHPKLLRRLPVVASSAWLMRDGRLVMCCQPPRGGCADAPGELSVRYTRAVQRAMAAAAELVVAEVVVSEVASAFPDASAQDIDSLLTGLVAHRILLTALRPPMTVTDPLGYVIGQLSAAGAEGIAEVAPVVRALTQIQEALTRQTIAEPVCRPKIRAGAAVAMKALSRIAEQPLAADLRLDCSVALPVQVAREAESAVAALARLTPLPFGSTAWQDYHVRFLERYGPGAMVPVLRLIDPELGLGLPAGYRGSLLPRSAAGLTDRDERLLTLAQSAAFDGASEILLTDELVSSLTCEQAEAPLPHVDLRFRLHAPARDALDRGCFTLAVTGLAPAGGSTTGRFLHLLDAADRGRMAAQYCSLPTLSQNATRAQISSPPLYERTGNVSRVPAIWPLISIAEHPGGEATIGLQDLAVTADSARLYLVSLSSGRPVEPVIMNSVELGHFTQPLARLLCELPRGRAAAFGTFAWGAASRLPFLPALRHGRTLLALPSWRIGSAELPSRDASLAEWADGLGAWRQRFRMPCQVDLGDDDQVLRLDLDRSADAALLRAELRRAGQATLRQAPEPGAFGWLDGRAHEITLAFASRRAPVPSLALRRMNGAVRITANECGMPGASIVAYAKLYSHPDHVPGILIRHLPGLWVGWDGLPLWWFVRYRDPRDHVRLRFLLRRSEDFGPVSARVGAWAADLRHSGLLSQVQWDTYYPETGRYGSGAAMAAAESVFAADSAAALSQLSLSAGSGTHSQALIAASLVDIAVSFMGDVGTGMSWLIDHVARDTATHPVRQLRQEAIRLIGDDGGFAPLHEISDSDQLVTAWETRRQALRDYNARLAATEEIDAESVLASLLHLHQLRAAGIDEDSERVNLRLARSAALAWKARSTGAAR